MGDLTWSATSAVAVVLGVGMAVVSLLCTPALGPVLAQTLGACAVVLLPCGVEVARRVHSARVRSQQPPDTRP